VDLVFLLLSRRRLGEHLAALAAVSDTCATRNSPLGCAEHQALPLCAAYFAITSIRDLRAAVLQSDSTPVSRPRRSSTCNSPSCSRRSRPPPAASRGHQPHSTPRPVTHKTAASDTLRQHLRPDS
jgi:hypothetical protein